MPYQLQPQENMENKVFLDNGWLKTKGQPHGRYVIDC